MLNLLPHLLTLIISLALCLYSWQRRHVPGASPFALIAASQTIWMFGLIQELTVPTLAAKLFWDHFQWAGSFGYSLGIYLFVLEAGQRQLFRFTWKWALVILPMALYWLAGWHPGWLAYITPGAEILPAQPFNQLIYPLGMFQQILSVYLYLFVVIAIIRGIKEWRRSNTFYRKQLQGILLGAFFPSFVSILGLLGLLSWFGQRDLSPYTFALSDLLFIISIFGYRIFDLTHIAYAIVFEKLRDPVVVFGADGILNAVNPAAYDLFELQPARALGHTAGEVFAHYPQLLQFIEAQQESRQRIELGGRRSRALYELTLSRLPTTRSRFHGWIAIFHQLGFPGDEKTTPLQRFTIELDRRQVQQSVFAEMISRFNAATHPADVLLALSHALDDLHYDTFSVWKRQGQNLVWDSGMSNLPSQLLALFSELARWWQAIDGVSLTIPLEQKNHYTRCYQTQTPAVLHNLDDLLIPISAQGTNFIDLPAWMQKLCREAVMRLGIQEHYVFPLGQYGIVFLNSTSHAPSIGQVEWVQLICQQAGVALDRLLAIEAYQTLNAELEERVQARTAQLETINRELETFSYSVSHDLRAPLRAISGFSSILVTDYADRFDEQGTHLLRRIQDATERMNNLIEALLNLSRLTRSKLQISTVNLYAIASEIADRLQQSAPQRHVDWRIQDDLSAQADQNLIRAALENLLSNAWKFTCQRERARIEVGSITLESEQRAFYVRDNGSGFDMAFADKLFTAFQRLHTEQEFEGTGIGLATVQRIIHRHGGRVWAEAKVGEGATFYFTLGA
jgi:signal transduction histidine kinase/PAS domain-containing protein